VREVHLSHLDPDPHVSGRGKAELEAAGARVIVGEGEEEARRTSGDSRWVSGLESRRWAHRQRTLVDAIMVGVRTVLVDNPELTARPEPGEGTRLPDGQPRQPLRVVVDSRGRTPASARVLHGPTGALAATTDASSEAWRQQIQGAGAEVVVLSAAGGRVDLVGLLRALGSRDILSLLVEGGGELLGSFFDLGLVDKVQAIIAPIIIGGQEAPAAVAGSGAHRMADALCLRDVTIERLGEDVLVTGYPEKTRE
jgi:diaminohydroxyphosphoribosylaminopyrimidine deaminase/5-amino-6-(5-phosphoribosylamino)uracil reductase